jgi:hypothetical protein
MQQQGERVPADTALAPQRRLDGVRREAERSKEAVYRRLGKKGPEVDRRRLERFGDVEVVLGGEGELAAPGPGDKAGECRDPRQLGDAEAYRARHSGGDALDVQAYQEEDRNRENGFGVEGTIDGHQQPERADEGANGYDGAAQEGNQTQDGLQKRQGSLSSTLTVCPSAVL